MNDTHLGPETEATISDLVGKGLFASRADVLREGVRLVHQRETRFAALDAALSAGVESVRVGRTKPAEEVLARLQAKFRTPARDED